MVQREQDHMFLLAQLEQTGAHRRARRQVERQLRFGMRQFLGQRQPVLGRVAAQVGDGQGQRQMRLDQLGRHAVEVDKARAQHRMAAEDFFECQRESGLVEATAEGDRRRHVVERAAGIDLVKKPQALLGVRQGPGTRVRAAENGLLAGPALGPFAQ